MDDGLGPGIDNFAELRPVEFERFVERALRAQGVGLNSFEVKHLEPIPGSDGEYAIDVTARFSALGADFRVLIECKHQRTRVKREVVQILVDKLRSTGSQKGMIFSSGGFQRGALEYAKVHGIALVKVVDGRSLYETKSLMTTPFYPPGLPKFAGWIIECTPTGHRGCLLGKAELERFREAFVPVPASERES